MKRLTAGVFKARCLEIIDEVEANREPVVVTKRGKPFVKIVPASTRARNIIGFMEGKVKIVGNVESPIPAVSVG